MTVNLNVSSASVTPQTSTESTQETTQAAADAFQDALAQESDQQVTTTSSLPAGPAGGPATSPLPTSTSSDPTISTSEVPQEIDQTMMSLSQHQAPQEIDQITSFSQPEEISPYDLLQKVQDAQQDITPEDLLRMQQWRNAQESTTQDLSPEEMLEETLEAMQQDPRIDQ